MKAERNGNYLVEEGDEEGLSLAGKGVNERRLRPSSSVTCTRYAFSLRVKQRKGWQYKWMKQGFKLPKAG
jgi:hypothetical protein